MQVNCRDIVKEVQFNVGKFFNNNLLIKIIIIIIYYFKVKININKYYLYFVERSIHIIDFTIILNFFSKRS